MILRISAKGRPITLLLGAIFFFIITIIITIIVIIINYHVLRHDSSAQGTATTAAISSASRMKSNCRGSSRVSRSMVEKGIGKGQELAGG